MQIKYVYFTFKGRRIEYDYDIYGDSPSCLGSNNNIIDGKTAFVQGYGYTEEGKFNWKFLKIIVIIEQNEC